MKEFIKFSFYVALVAASRFVLTFFFYSSLNYTAEKQVIIKSYCKKFNDLYCTLFTLLKIQRFVFFRRAHHNSYTVLSAMYL